MVKDRETFYRRHTVLVTICSEVKYVLKRVFFGSKDCTKELKLECAYSWARLASFCHLGFISDPLIVSKFHNETYDPKGQENKIYTIVYLSRDMRFPTMWYMQPAMAQTSLCIRAV